MHRIALSLIPFLAVLPMNEARSEVPPAAQTEAMPQDVRSLVEAERAFARRAIESSIRDAFYENLAPHAILMSPGPVNGYEQQKKRPPNPGPLLIWEPAHAEISASGDLGWTTGPAEFRPAKDKDPAWFGEFSSVWQKQPDGAWKVVIDHGHDVPSRIAPKESVTWARIGGKSAGAAPLDAKHHDAARNALAETEAGYEKALGTRGLEEALSEFADGAVRVNRDGHFSALGAKEAAHSFGEEELKPKIVRWRTETGIVSKAGDLGYTYGTVELAPASGKAAEPADSTKAGPPKRVFVRIWRRAGDGPWRIALDVTTPMRGG